jgi:hopanoid biosynthesis associated RND transporter like protein HpnN
MLRSTIARIVDFSTRNHWPVIAAALVVAVLAGIYAARHFAMDTDINHLLSTNLPWRQHEVAYEKAFRQRAELTLVVVEAPTPENAKRATRALVTRLSERHDRFRSVVELGGGEFFDRNGLLYLPAEEVERNTTLLLPGQPLLGTLASDPSLRGVLDGLTLGAMGVQIGRIKLDDMARPLTMASETLDTVLARQQASFSWRVLAKGKPAETNELRHFIQVHPILDFGALEPGKAATDAIRQAAAELKLGPELGARVRLTGPVPLSDEEFATLRQSAPVDVFVTIIAVIVILWLALRSAGIILACFISLMVGLAATAALGLLMVGALNLISVAFAVLFIGLGVDFGLQFSVRYRAERHEVDNLGTALRNTGGNIGAQLTLAAAAVAAGFFSFLPTEYRGLSELGLIAGAGMLIAYVTSVTLLPALVAVFNPPGEPHPLGFTWLAPVDRFMERHRIAIVVVTLAVAVVGSPLLYFLHFDFNVLNMRSAAVESVATYLDLRRDASAGINSIYVLKPSLAEADKAAPRLAELPEVSRAITLSNFVPEDQDKKLALIRRAATPLNARINPPSLRPPPSDAENVHALNTTADTLNQLANEEQGPGAQAARRLAALLTRLGKADAEMRARAEAAFVPSLQSAMDDLRNGLKAEPVKLDTLPAELKRDWIAPDGRALIDVSPKGDANDNEVLRRFATAVLAVEPNGTGSPVSLQESGRTVVRAFIEAGLWALVSITILLWIVLRRFGDVLLTLVPLLLAGVVTLEICVLIGLPLNFANIIALPLLLGVGVAFKIYYVMAWRAGQTALLQSSLTRAVFFSALTTATAFGSLWMSSHPGMSSMGKLLVLSLMCTLAAAVLFQPALMGPPRDKKSKRAKAAAPSPEPQPAA